MRQVATALIAMTCLAFSATADIDAQPVAVSVGFKNQTNTNVIVQGTTIVNGFPVREGEGVGVAFFLDDDSLALQGVVFRLVACRDLAFGIFALQLGRRGGCLTGDCPSGQRPATW